MSIICGFFDIDNCYVDGINLRSNRVITTDVELSAEQWDKLLAIAEKTPVTLTVQQGASIAARRG